VLRRRLRRFVIGLSLGLVVVGAASGCGGAKKKKPHDASESSSEGESDAEVRIEYVPIAVAWVKHHTKGVPASVARKLADDMLSRMQSSSESLDAIADAAIKASLDGSAISDPKRRKAVTLAAAQAGDADLPPDAKEALAAFARKAHAGDVVDSPLGSGPVLVVARAVK
jgi:hypothetical protein